MTKNRKILSDRILDLFSLDLFRSGKLPEADEITFKPSDELTLGVEIELQLLDPETLNLAPRAADLLAATTENKKIKPEFYLSTVEINTGICKNVQEVEQDLSASLDYMTNVGKTLGLNFATTGCHPFAKYADCVISPTERYHELIDRNQWLTRRMTVYGMHVHLGMKDGDECIRFNNFFMNFLPHLLALSSSSPFWQGDDTGLASCRPTTYEALPTAGRPYMVANWREFEHLYGVLKKSGAIKSLRDLWWDMRPSPVYGTLEIRVCDGLATLEETLALVSFIHLLAHWFREQGSWMDRVLAPPTWIIRENKWRAIRHGAEADLVTSSEGASQPIRDDIEQWLNKIAPITKQLDYGSYIQALRGILYNGTSTQRQRHVFQKNHSLKDVVQHNIAEFETRKPLLSAT